MKKSLFFILVSLLLFRCSTPTKAPENKLANSYQFGTTSLHVKYVFYNVSADTTQVYFKIKNEDLLYAKENGEDNFESRFKLSYLLYENTTSPIFVDSGSYIVKNVIENISPAELIGSFKIKTTQGSKYFIRIKSRDLIRNTETEKLLYFNRSKKLSNSDFLFTNKEGDLPSFKSFYQEQEKIYLKYNGITPFDSFEVVYFNKEAKPPLPPFSMYNPKPFDYKYEAKTIIKNNDNRFEFVQQHKAGFYLITDQLENKQGLGVNVVYEDYPQFNSSEQMLKPLKYITSKKEYKKLYENSDPRQALESFWLKVGKSQDRSKTLIQTYYNRVKNANALFNSYKEGWATDRGMIYIIFGPPEKVKQINNVESWIYGEENSYLSPTFNFIKVENPFTENDFILQRSSSYKDAWYREVEMWRQGRVSELDF